MESQRPSQRYAGWVDKPFSKDAVLIIGAGYFGRRAASVLTQKSDSLVLIIDKDESSLARIRGLPVKKILGDGIDFLVDNFHFLNSSNYIIPAVPVHLVFEWLKSSLGKEFKIKQIEVAEKIKSFLPHTWKGSEGSLLVSYADFRCPDECTEPAGYCPVTEKKREAPLYELLRQLDLPGYKVYIIRSHQLTPGLGGYKVGELKRLLDRVRQLGKGKWLVGTACGCHGIVRAMRVVRDEN